MEFRYIEQKRLAPVSQGKQVQDARVVFGGIAGKPWREKPVEDFGRERR
jgi:CO/xanthine dehydrogenase FAD-binding subunit